MIYIRMRDINWDGLDKLHAMLREAAKEQQVIPANPKMKVWCHQCGTYHNAVCCNLENQSRSPLACSLVK
ncbi:MAG: hypothetical protein Unbinned3891contig1000_15 [Prokaryotic dsDNA virus sp.]|mgnify:CR=1 FL=1|nr:MAG: hypothetical protein Unbinned3891contig1000_15 [Prokaryotic dsDNA virus sp.]|tara:strand:- start:17806 stop:18015 length:210 start_codon:yes stop_codon:yes gene_type:complete